MSTCCRRRACIAARACGRSKSWLMPQAGLLPLSLAHQMLHLIAALRPRQSVHQCIFKLLESLSAEQVQRNGALSTTLPPTPGVEVVMPAQQPLQHLERQGGQHGEQGGLGRREMGCPSWQASRQAAQSTAP